MKIYILIIIGTLFFSGCATSSLKINDANELLLKHDNKVSVVGTKVLSRESQWYQNIDIYKSKIQNTQGVLLHEDVILDINWEFRYGSVATIKFIFDSFDSDIIFMNSNLVLLQLKVSKSQYVNMLVEKSDIQELSYVYGFSNDEFLKLAYFVKTDNDYMMPKLKHEAIVFKQEIKPLSTWSVKMLFLESLIKPVMRRGR